MSKWRVIILAILLAAVAGAYLELRKRGEVRLAEQWYLGFLVANAREKLETELPNVSPNVVLVKFDEKDRDEYGGWPPVTLDWLMVMKRLAAFSPEVVAVVEPLNWEGAAGEFVRQLRESMLPFPSVVLGFGVSAEGREMSETAKAFTTEGLPEVRGAIVSAQAAQVNGVTIVPDRVLRTGMHTGFSSVEGLPQSEYRELLVAAYGEKLVPSFAAQVVTLFRRAPFATMRLIFGAGAHLSLADEYVVPLTPRGELHVGSKPEVPVVDALDLLLPDLGDEASKELAQVLGKGKVVILSTNADAAMKQVRAVATGLGYPALKRSPAYVEWGMALVAALWCLLHLIRKGRFGGILLGVVAVALVTGVNIGIFQTQLMWWSPLLAFGMIAATAVFVFLSPYKERASEEDKEKDKGFDTTGA